MVTETDLTTTTAAEPLTGDDLLDLPSGMGQRYELIEGELVIKPPTNTEHGFVENRVAFILTAP